MRVNSNGYSTIEQASAAFLNGASPVTLAVEGDAPVKSFAEILTEKRDKLNASHRVSFSKHAAERLNDRNIELSERQLERLDEGIKAAGDKGINSSLVMVDDLAFIVNTQSNTVVTAMDPAGSDKNIFTNIDGAVIA